MNIEQLYYLIEIADSGSITQAAKKLHISQPSISQSITKLEEKLQVTIFKRSRMGTYPTEIGETIIKKAREIIFKIEELERVGKTKDSLIAGSLSLAAIPSLCITLLPKALEIYKNKYPNVKIEIVEGGSMQVKELVKTGKVDLGLASSREISDYNEELIFESLLTGQIMACVGKQSKLSNRKEISFKEIVKHSIVIFNEQYRMNPYILNKLREYGEPDILLTTGNTEILKKVVIEGLAIGFYADIALKNDPYVYNGDIIPLYIVEQKKDPSTNTHFGILYKSKTHLSAACEEFIKELRTQGMNLKRVSNMK
ncbi:LysR family transcriptional regulator [Sporosarcina sp. FSL W7-1349]|uniref:LysR family transcriptional regulator n=1 Tax=Sporosarcina sp. FSL W7-1349 TaxID=2921561 RepID=UPI0030F818C2